MEDSLSSSVELISASPSPQRAAPDKTRLLTWHTPRQPAPPSGLTADSDSDSDTPSGGRQPRPAPAPFLIDDDSPDPSAARSRPRSPVVISDDDGDDAVTVPPASERRRPRPLVISDEDEDDDDTIPCSQQRRADTARPGRRSEEVVEASFEGEELGGWRKRWGKSAVTNQDTTATTASSAVFSAATATAADNVGDSQDTVRAPTGQDGDMSGASLIGSDESWDGTSVTSGRSSREGDTAEDPRDRAQRLYSKYTIKKRTTSPAESSQVGDGQTSIKQTGAGSGQTPPSGQGVEQSPDSGRREEKPAPSATASPPTGAGGTGNALTGGPRSRTMIVVPTKAASEGTTSGSAQGSAGPVGSSPDVSLKSSPGSGTEARPPPAAQASRDTTVRNRSAGAAAGDTSTESEPTDDRVDLSYLSIHELEQQLKQKEMVARVSNLSALPDGGRRLRATIQQLRSVLEQKRSGSARPAAPRPVPANTGGSSSKMGSGSGGGIGSQLRQVQAQIRQKKMEYSTNAHRADAARSAQLQREIFKLETEMMKLQMAKGAGGPGGRNPFSLNSTVSRPPALNRPRGEAGQRLGPPPAAPTEELEAALRRGGPTTAVMTEEQRRLEAEARESLRDFGQIRPQLTAALLASNPGAEQTLRRQDDRGTPPSGVQRDHRGTGATAPLPGDPAATVGGRCGTGLPERAADAAPAVRPQLAAVEGAPAARRRGARRRHGSGQDADHDRPLSAGSRAGPRGHQKGERRSGQRERRETQRKDREG